MSDLDERFQAAAVAARSLSRRPDNEALLQLYALYKQATAGDVSGSRPGMLDLVGRAKYDAWARHKGTSRSEAQTAYIALVERLE